MTKERMVGPGGGDFALNPNRFGGGRTSKPPTAKQIKATKERNVEIERKGQQDSMNKQYKENTKPPPSALLSKQRERERSDARLRTRIKVAIEATKKEAPRRAKNKAQVDRAEKVYNVKQVGITKGSR